MYWRTQASRKRLARSEARLAQLTAAIDKEEAPGASAGAREGDGDDDRSEDSDERRVSFARRQHTPRRASSVRSGGGDDGHPRHHSRILESSASRSGEDAGGAADRRTSGARRLSMVNPSDRKYHTEEELLRVTLPLDDRVLFDTTPSAVIVVTTVGLMVSVNAYAHTMLGYEPGTLNGRPVEIIMPKEFREGHRGLME